MAIARATPLRATRCAARLVLLLLLPLLPSPPHSCYGVCVAAGWAPASLLVLLGTSAPPQCPLLQLLLLVLLVVLVLRQCACSNRSE